MKNLITNIQEGRNHLEKVAKEKGITHFFIDNGTDREGDDILILIQEDENGNSIKNIAQVKY